MTTTNLTWARNPSTNLLTGGYVPMPDNLKYAENYFAVEVMPFQIIRPAPASSVVGFYSPDFYGYIGRETQIRITAQGGAYPYAAVIDDAPFGATISNDANDYANYLVLKFTPTANGTYPIKVRVYDADGGNLKTINYTFTVSAAWCVFADPILGVDLPGNGTFASPFKSIHYARNNTTGGKALILKNGVYADTQLGITLNSVSVNSILAWQSGQAIIDLISNVETSPSILFYMNSSHILAQGIVVRNPQNMVASPRIFSGDSATNYVFQDDCRFEINGRSGTNNGDNVSCFFFGSTNRQYIAQTRCKFSGFVGLSNGWSAWDWYGVSNSVVACNECSDQVSSSTSAGMLWPKGVGCRKIDIRSNKFNTIFSGALIDVYLGNAGDVDNITGEIDVSFNLIRAQDNYGIWIARGSQNGIRLPVWSRRNTVINGLIMIFKRSYGVIFSSDSDVIQSPISTADPHKIILRNSASSTYETLSSMPTLTASVTNYECQANSGVVDINGILTNSYASYRGIRGHEITRV